MIAGMGLAAKSHKRRKKRESAAIISFFALFVPLCGYHFRVSA
jgi:hypothetical protein